MTEVFVEQPLALPGSAISCSYFKLAQVPYLGTKCFGGVFDSRNQELFESNTIKINLLNLPKTSYDWAYLVKKLKSKKEEK